MCGDATDEGHRESPSDSFTAWAQLYAGEVVCPACHAMLKAPLRRTAWLATSAGIRSFTSADRGAMLTALLDPPAPPSAWYVTRGRQKQAWLSLMHRVTQGRELLWIGVDWQEPAIPFVVSWAQEIVPLVSALRGRGVAKAALSQGTFASGTWMKAMRDGWEQDLRSAARWAGHPQWEVLVFCHV
jgi:CRISPR type IV-associated protein Csf1